MNIRPTSLSARHSGQHQAPRLFCDVPVKITREADGRFSTQFGAPRDAGQGLPVFCWQWKTSTRTKDST